MSTGKPESYAHFKVAAQNGLLLPAAQFSTKFTWQERQGLPFVAGTTVTKLDTVSGSQLDVLVQEKDEQLQSMMAENAELQTLLADCMRANHSQNQLQLPKPDDPLAETPANLLTKGHLGPHFCVKSWLTFFSAV